MDHLVAVAKQAWASGGFGVESGPVGPAAIDVPLVAVCPKPPDGQPLVGSAKWARVHEADIKLLGSMFRWQVCRPSGWDPRISVRRLAEEAALPRSTVWERLRAWKESGFFQGYQVLPNPLIFDDRMAAFFVTCADNGQKAPLIAALELMDGFAGGIELLGRDTIVNFVGAGVGALERKARLLSQMPGVEAVEGPLVYPSWEKRPPAPDAKDLRLLRRLVDDPEVAMDELGARAGVSERTAKRRYAELIAKRQLLFRPELRYDRLDGATAMVLIGFDHTHGEKALGLELLRRFPDFIPFCDPFETAGQETVPRFIAMARRASPAAFEAVTLALRNVPGVTDAATIFPVRAWATSTWCKERLAQLT